MTFASVRDVRGVKNCDAMRKASVRKIKNMLRSLGLAGMMGLVLLSAPASALDVVNDDLGGVVESYMARTRPC